LVKSCNAGYWDTLSQARLHQSLPNIRRRSRSSTQSLSVWIKSKLCREEFADKRRGGDRDATAKRTLPRPFLATLVS